MSNELLRVAIAFSLTFTVAGVCSAPGSAQQRRTWQGVRLGEHAALWQARSCVGEVLYDDLEACTAMAYVHLRRSRIRGTTFSSTVRAYSSPLKAGSPQSWVRMLHPTAPRPRKWRRTASYRRAQQRFVPVLRHVEAVLRDEVDDPCGNTQPLHHGARNEGVSGFVRDRTCAPHSRQRFLVRVHR